MSKKLLVWFSVVFFQFVNSKEIISEKILNSNKKLSKEDIDLDCIDKNIVTDKDFISFSSHKEDVTNLYKGISFKTKNGLTIVYYGNRYTSAFLKDLLSSCKDSSEEFFRLSNLNFESIKFSSKDCLEIKDSLKIKSIDFYVTYEDENIIKSKTYSKDNWLVLSYYNDYLNVAGLKLKQQSLSPITLKDLQVSIDKLKLHFIRLGYSYVEVGYKIIQDAETKALDIVYLIDLGQLKANSIKFVGGRSNINYSLKSQYPRYRSAIFEVTGNYLCTSQFIEFIKNKYFEFGYFSVKVDCYFNDYEKLMVYNIHSGERFVIDGFNIDTSVCDFVVSDNKKKKIKKILEKDSSKYIKNKKDFVERVLSDLYDQDEYTLNCSLNKNYYNKSVFMNFTFERRRSSPNKILTAVKCIGNSKVSSNTIKNVLGKKIGDMVSKDDVYALRSALIRTGCFESVTIKLDDVDSGYELFVEVKEGPLWNFGNSMLSFDPAIALNLDFTKKNFNNEGKTFNFLLRGEQTESKKNQSFTFRVSIDDFLPNGNSFSAGVYVRWIGDIFEKLRSQKTNLFDQDSGFHASGYLATELFGFDHDFNVGIRNFPAITNNPQHFFLSVDTNLMRKILQSYSFWTMFSLDNSIVVYPQSKEIFFDTIILECKHYRKLSSRTKILIRFFGGSMFSPYIEAQGRKTLGIYHAFQSLGYDSDLGCWGEVQDGLVVGGNCRLGAMFKVMIDMNFSFTPDFFLGSYLFAQVEGGSIFNRNTSNIQDNFISGSSFGIEAPILGGQINLKVYYFLPFHNNATKSLTKKGLNVGISFNLQQNV